MTETKLLTPCLDKAFLKNKLRSTASLPASFSALFLGKHFHCHALLLDQISMSGCLYFVRYRAIWVLGLFVNQVVTS